ncbi:actin-like ATPase domain-containing protein [Rhizophagus irregularis]|uniref:Actin-like ATPase domain-containing protein n=1 Tax=Rhizophagus irregularis TaxID=588596 RepID=A0A2N0PZG4_9GLOM|nr:actin-like ATPase domain-containing protein [Rhizophagus irregularis]
MKYNLNTGASFMTVDCGGGTVDLTTRQLLDGNKMGEVTERTGDNCGSSFVDQEFVKFLGRKLGKSVIENLKKDHYGLLQYIVQEFCRRVKFQFSGQQSDFQPFDIDLDEYKLIKQYVTGEEKNRMEESDWFIEIEFEEIKAMFDPVIGRIIRLIRGQLEKNDKKCSALMLTGGFSESRYLQARIKREFGKIVPNISVPIHPIIAIIKGGVQFGFQEERVVNRVLKRTYGTDIARVSQPDDPPSEKFPNGLTVIFEALVKRGEQVPANNKVVKTFIPCSLMQKKIGFNMYVTENTDAKFCNDPGVSLLRNWEIELPEIKNIEDIEDVEDTIISFTLSFGTVEILATAENQKAGTKYHVSFKCE